MLQNLAAYLGPHLDMTEALPANGMQHVFAHDDDAASLPSPPSFASRSPPPSNPADDQHLPQSPPRYQTVPSARVSEQPFSNTIARPSPAQLVREITPPPSSALSSQEGVSIATITSQDSDKTKSPKTSTPAVTHDADSTGSSTSSPLRGDVSREALSGPKRTASGQIKRSSITSVYDLKPENNGTRHSRTSSLMSNGSNGSVMELSQQLRTRLNYAMVKVQNGWQSRSLDELESLASQSPRSTVSGFQNNSNGHILASPRTSMATNLHRKYSSSSSSDGGNQCRPQTSDLNGGYTNGRTYQPGQMMARRALAPPADIVPGARRRPHPNGYSSYSPQLQLNTSRPKPKLRTPSQNAAMEADAVETLLFMASPNNSGHHPATFSQHESSLRSTQGSQLQTSPLRSQFSGNEVMFSPKKVAFAPDARSIGMHGTGRTKPYDKAADIDRMLDEIDDDDSSDDLTEAFAIAERRRAEEAIL